jgi:predicted nucleic-acid-binding protein
MSNPEIRAALDTSVVMRLLTGQPSELAHVARVYLAETEQLKAKVYVPNLVIMEAYFACQHHYHMPKAAAIQGLHTLLSQPTFAVYPQLLTLLATDGLATAQPGLLEQLIHAEARSAHLSLVTFEKAAARLPHTQVLRGELIS